jgi:hypothetical protein
MEFRFEVLKTDPTGARPGVASAPSRGGRVGFRARRFRRRADSRTAAKFAARFRAYLPSDFTQPARGRAARHVHRRHARRAHCGNGRRRANPRRARAPLCAIPNRCDTRVAGKH